MQTLLHTYSYRNYDFAFVCARAHDMGWDGLELCVLHYDIEHFAEDLPWKCDTARTHGTTVQCVCCFANPLLKDACERREEADKATAYIRTLSECGITRMNTYAPVLEPEPGNPAANGSACATADDYRRAADFYREIAEYARDQGVSITLEIHGNTLHDTASSCAGLLDEIKSPCVKANLDLGNMHAIPHAEDALEAIAILGDRLGYVHLKNCVRLAGHYSCTVALQDGDIDYCRVMDKLLSNGYQGDLCVEYCGEGDPTPRLQSDRAYVNSLLKACVRCRRVSFVEQAEQEE